MKSIPTAEIICVGTELLLGDIVNTNAPFLSKELAKLGIPVYRHTCIGDNENRLKKTITEAFFRSNLIIMTGGLGPTYDDLTKETIASYFEKRLVMNEECLKDIRQYFENTKRVMTDNNKKQAMIPEGATVLKNSFGTAPGIAISNGQKTAILLPGPPSEMQPMYYESVLPYLMSQFETKPICSRFIHLFGIGESNVESELRTLMDSENPTLAPYAKEGEVRLRVTASAESEAEAYKLCDEMVEKVKKSSVGKYILGIDIESIEKAFVGLCTNKGLKVAVSESCTGGLIAKRITDIPGASKIFLGGCIAYSNDVKIGVLGVNEDTIRQKTEVSLETAREMAERTRELYRSDLAISTTGIAGPDGGNADNPVGTVYIGISSRFGTEAYRINVSPRKTRDSIRNIAVNHAFLFAISEIHKY